jgi:hypothetical protein
MRFAHLKTHHRFERMRLRGLSGARDEFHLAAIVQNLKTLAIRIWRPPPNLPATYIARACGASNVPHASDALADDTNFHQWAAENGIRAALARHLSLSGADATGHRCGAPNFRLVRTISDGNAHGEHYFQFMPDSEPRPLTLTARDVRRIAIVRRAGG